MEERPKTASSHVSQSGRTARDPRIDFFRGIALICIFVDHVPDNRWASLTFRNFGFSDASEIFVLLSGYSAALAYGAAGRAGPPNYRRALHRAAEIYLWHLGLFAVSAVILFTAALHFNRPAYVDNIWLQNLLLDPVTWLRRAALLTYQPNLMNILPLYVVLMLVFPALLIIMRRTVAGAMALSFGIWALANAYELNLPANKPGEGWHFNPLAWQFLFAAGAAAAMGGRGLALRWRVEWLGAALLVAISYIVFAFVYASPWVPISWLPDVPAFGQAFLGHMSKSYLSIWRFAHAMALMFVIAMLLPPGVAWLQSRAARVVMHCGRNSLELFVLGTLLSFLAWIVLLEVGTSAMLELVVTAAGVAAMFWAGQMLTHLKTAQRPQGPAPALAA